MSRAPEQWMKDAAKEFNRRQAERNHILRAKNGETAPVMTEDEYIDIIASHAPQEPAAAPTLRERRAEFVYNAARLAAIAAKAPIVPVVWAERESAFKAQFLDVIDKQCGPQRSNSPEELHGTWVEAYEKMGWKYGEKYDRAAKIHPDMVPYAELGQLERDKDAVFVMLCDIARQYVYEGAAPPERRSGRERRKHQENIVDGRYIYRWSSISGARNLTSEGPNERLSDRRAPQGKERGNG